MAASRGGGMGGKCPPVGGSAPPLAPQSEEKNGQNQPFSANFWIFAPSWIAFCPLDAPPPQTNFWCRHWVCPATGILSCLYWIGNTRIYRQQTWYSLARESVSYRKSWPKTRFNYFPDKSRRFLAARQSLWLSIGLKLGTGMFLL